LPYVAEPGSKTKLSKRKLDKYLKNPDFARLHQHGLAIAEAIGHDTAAETFNPVIVDFYETVGYLPQAILNYLLLLGWSLDETTETFSRKEMAEHFSLERIQKAAASFDPQKLSAFQERYMQELSLKRKLELCLPYLEQADLVASPASPESAAYAERIIAAAGDRIKVGGDILDYAEFFLPDAELAYDDKAFDNRIRKPEDAAGLLARFREHLAAAPAFDAESLEELMRRFVEEEGVGLGRIIHAVRVAVTGKGVGFGMFDILSILGRERCLARIDGALSRLD
jgi:glutamyl-tRNA synthetase